MSNLVSFEPYVDSTMRVFCDQLEARFVLNCGPKPPPCDFGQWLQMFAFDVIGEITFSKRLGFLERGEDVDGVIASIWNTFKKTSLVSCTKSEQQAAISDDLLGYTNAVVGVCLDQQSTLTASERGGKEPRCHIRNV